MIARWGRRLAVAVSARGLRRGASMEEVRGAVARAYPRQSREWREQVVLDARARVLIRMISAR